MHVNQARAPVSLPRPQSFNPRRGLVQGAREEACPHALATPEVRCRQSVSSPFWCLGSLVQAGVILCLLLPVMARAQFDWRTNTDNTVVLTGYTGTNVAVDIPSVVNGMVVVGIGESVFTGSKVTSVTVPGSILSIGERAFETCYALTNVTLRDGLIAIGQFAFWGNPLLTDIVVPDSVTSIGASAFGNCGLTSVTLGRGVTDLADWVFERWNEGPPCSVFFKGNAPKAGTNTFHWYTPLGGTAGERPSSVYCLSGATGWSNTFAGRPVVELNQPPRFRRTPDGWEYLSDGGRVVVTRYFGASLTPVVPATIDGLPVTEIGPFTFQLTQRITDVTIPTSVAGIADYAFYDTQLTSVTIPDSVVRIGDYAFAQSPNNCCSYSLIRVTIGNSIAMIGDGAFDRQYALEEVAFFGDAPAVGFKIFDEDAPGRVQYLPGTMGWSSVFAGWPTEAWHLPTPRILRPGPWFSGQTDEFGFTISWAKNVPVVVEACTDLTNPNWSPVATNKLAGGKSDFRDPAWRAQSTRFYRLRQQ